MKNKYKEDTDVMKKDIKDDYIVYVGNFDISNLNAAGKRVLNISKLLEKIGYKVFLVESTKKQMNINRMKKITNNITLYSFEYPTKLYKWCFYKEKVSKLIKIMGSLNVKYIIFYGSPTASCFISKMLKYNRNNNIISISDVVDILTPEYKNPVKWILKTIDNKNRLWLNKQMDGLFVISNYLKNYYNNVPSVVIPPLMEYNSSNLNNKNNLNKYIKIYYSGIPFRIGKKNCNTKHLKDRIDLIVDVMTYFKNDIKLDIYGLNKNDFLNAFPKYKDRITDNISFLGNIDNKNLLKKLPEYDFSILIRNNSRAANAGFPTKISESISIFVPVITNDTSDIKKYIKDGKNGFVIDTYEKSELHDILKKIISLNGQEIYNMKRYCKENQLFDYRRYEDILVDFLDKI